MASRCRLLLALAVLLLAATACGRLPGLRSEPGPGKGAEVGVQADPIQDEGAANRPLAAAGASRDQGSPYYRPEPLPDRFAPARAGEEDAPWNRPAVGPLSLEVPTRTPTRAAVEPVAAPEPVAASPEEGAAPPEEPSVTGPEEVPAGTGSLLDGDTRLQRARARKERAFKTYTRLVTEGGEGDVEAALREYKEAIQEVKTLEQGR